MLTAVMARRGWPGSARPVVVIVTTVAVLSTTALGLLSWQLLQQDRDLEAPRLRGLVESAADRAVVVMTAAVARLDAAIVGTPHVDLPAGVSLATITAERSVVWPSTEHLPFLPTRQLLPEAQPSIFAEATAAEVLRNDLGGALGLYRGLAVQRDRAIRAGALARLAPTQARLGDVAGALRAYDDLAALDDVAVGGLPAGLVASVGRATVLADRGPADALRAAAGTLASDLAGGRWALTSAEYEFYAGEASRWMGGAPAAATDDGVARADGAVWAWNSRNSLPADGRRLLTQRPGPALIVWRRSGDAMSIAVAGPAFLNDLVRTAVPAPFVATLRDLEGRPALGAAGEEGEAATRVASPTGLPWTLELTAPASAAALQNPTRRRLLLLVLGITVLMVGAGWYVIGRTLAREGRAARLQQAFVASVSHEFRSPLTSIAHVSDLLSADRLRTDDQRRHAYQVLVSDAARLHDMVENLLDFSRFDAGTMALRCERLDVVELVRQLVDDARRRVAPAGYAIELACPTDALFARIDGGALGRALWNLIENAVKYSPECRTVWVEVARDDDGVGIAVRDRGLGIPASEHEAVFRRFVRGAESESRHIRGTGIGLALVRQIVEAHGGRVTLDSTPGRGSSFTIYLREATSVARVVPGLDMPNPTA
jgi:signal transduction histidine kinase